MPITPGIGDAGDDDPPPRPPNTLPGIPDYPSVDDWSGGWDGSLPGTSPIPTPTPAPTPAPPSEEDSTETDDFVEVTSLFTVDESSLSTKTYQYGGVGVNCRSKSTEWADMPTVPYWLEGSISGEMRGSTLTIESRGSTYDDAWMNELPDEYLTVVVGDNAYVELSVKLVASGNLPDFVKSFDVCLESGDSISATVGDALYNFSLVKGGVECISSMVTDLNALFTSFSVEVTINRAVYCSYEREESPLPPPEGDEGTYEGGDSSEWTQTDSWVLLGVVVLLGLIVYVRSSLTGGESGE